MLKINVRVIPKSSKEKIEYFDLQEIFKIWTKVAPINGEANKSVVEIVAKFFGVNKNCVQIISGLSSKNKIIEVVTDKKIEDFIKAPRLF